MKVSETKYRNVIKLTNGKIYRIESFDPGQPTLHRTARQYTWPDGDKITTRSLEQLDPNEDCELLAEEGIDAELNCPVNRKVVSEIKEILWMAYSDAKMAIANAVMLYGNSGLSSSKHETLVIRAHQAEQRYNQFIMMTALVCHLQSELSQLN